MNGRKTSIRSQLMSLIVTAVFGAVALATGAYVLRDVAEYGEDRVRELETSASVFAAAISASVAADDERATLEALRAINSMPGLNYVQVDRRDGSVFVELGDSVAIGRRGSSENRSFNPFDLLKTRTLSVEAPVVHGGERIGRLTITADTSALSAMVWRVVWDALSASAFAAVIGLLLALRMQRSLTSPIIDLARIMRD
ncbi:MAG: hypothetical protein KDE05_12840, partial [Parvularculaceae bacterium]|nr:hypothetical protein [Parvularculaceae bacterium]